jgi:hypothetical protein
VRGTSSQFESIWLIVLQGGRAGAHDGICLERGSGELASTLHAIIPVFLIPELFLSPNRRFIAVYATPLSLIAMSDMTSPMHDPSRPP